MAGETNSTNMNMPIPGVGVTSGPTWASDYNSCLRIIDAHDHTNGSGVQITPSGVNISSDLSFKQNSATNLLKVSMTSQSGALTGTGFLSNINGNLYFNDGSGNQIAITSGGGVAGSPGSIGSLASPASATYTSGSKLFSWRADSGKAAAMDNGAVTIRETNVASAKGITFASPSSLASDYTLTLLTGLPGSTQTLNCDASGNLGTISYDSIGSSMSSVGANAISATRTRVTGTTVSAGGVAISSASGNFSTTTTESDVTNLSVTITTSGRPVSIGFISDGSGSAAMITITTSTTAIAQHFIYLYSGASNIGQYLLALGADTGNRSSDIPASSIQFIDTPAAGTYTYKARAVRNSNSSSATINNVKLIAYEL